MDFVDLFIFSVDLKVLAYLGLFGIIFSETGLFLSPFLPADSILLSASFLATQGYFNFGPLLLAGFFGAFLGDNAGYAVGRKIGPQFFSRDDSAFFSKKNLERTHRFFARHGVLTVLFARFIPGLRVFGPLLAGVGTMRYRVFVFWDLLGSAVWSAGISFLGYFIGKSSPVLGWYAIFLLVGVLVASSLIGFLRIWRDKEEREEIKSFFKEIFSARK